MLTDLEGQTERITYVNEENGFTIAKVKVKGRQDLVTVVGNMLPLTPGEIIKMTGEWDYHPKFGEQFKIAQYTIVIPATVDGIKKYLGSGLIRGIGSVMAGRIVEKFGQRTLEIIEKDFEKLAQVEGIGQKRMAMIARAWEEQKEIRDVMLFLQSHGVSASYAAKIFKQYGNQAVQLVRENPYRLASDIFGIGFVTADQIAEKMGFPKNSKLRAEAGVIYALNQLSDEGHVYYPYEALIQKCQEILNIDRKIILEAFAVASFREQIVIEELNRVEDYKEDNKAVYLKPFHVSETGVADSLKNLLTTPKSIRKIDANRAMEWVQRRLDIRLARGQIEAIKRAATDKVMVITGGPGTGKTTLINAVTKIFRRIGVSVMLAAPTGRAAKRMSEATGLEAKTIHRMLKFNVRKRGFQKNGREPLKCDLLIVDEASMIDVTLMHHLLKAVPPGATFILVGDVNQLPSVGAGNVLNDIIASKVVPVVRLKDIFRQAEQSSIIINAHKINQGRLPELRPLKKELSDFYFIEQEDPEEVLRIIIELTRDRIPKRFGFDSVENIQVLTPMHRGIVGAGNLNLKLAEVLNPKEGGLRRGAKVFRVGDKVMQIRNDYEKDVFNGDIGRIARIDQELQEVIISFDDRKVAYGYTDLDQVVLAYAISIHKSQGSEYPAVVIPLLFQHYLLLQRNLIYTAVTRGRKLVVLVGSRKALATAIRNNRTQRRFTYLTKRLK
ncbi:MAG: ATP-dependent RecD-like DNA helicase [Deltaproteobacteria bacterium]|nr:ATP-dependent RecD-like DNA helicase [Deltaproteobacteria bacterium]MBW2052652.1 ATP-dependent RecD-like DNA helicase [Deltaproteobacteria bacterium]MBW2141531.1 ATP-dependent RecD-like DNA helicase [Deltaproteobacteria bacterium]MBW2323458.1 ATP-dependent RecD-like DNA helicase [Deltaproteobacteria bacterium]